MTEGDHATDAARLDTVEQQLKEMANQRKRDERSFVGKFGRLGVIVGCLGGILGGSNTLIQLWKEYRAAPDIELQTATDLDFGWVPAERRVDFKCALSLRNNGSARGALQKPHATIRSCFGSATGLMVKDVKLAENKFDASFPVKVNPDAARSVELIVQSDAIPSVDTVFGADRPYELIIELDPSEVQPATARYSFSLGQGALTELNERNAYSQSGKDPRCRF